MRKLSFASLLFISIHSFSQTQKEILEEAERLYKSEMASWYGSDLFREKVTHKRQQANVYLSYTSGDSTICIFFSRGTQPKVVASFHFDSTFSTRTAIIDDKDREPTAQEAALIAIREKAMHAYLSDTLFKSYKEMNPNFIPLNDEKGKRVYVLTAPSKDGVVVLRLGSCLTNHFFKTLALNLLKKQTLLYPFHNTLPKSIYNHKDS